MEDVEDGVVESRGQVARKKEVVRLASSDTDGVTNADIRWEGLGFGMQRAASWTMW